MPSEQNLKAEDCLTPAIMVDADHPLVMEFADRKTAGLIGEVEKAIALYSAVRDDFRYDPYSIDLSEQGLSASHVVATGRGWCVSKAALLAACCRYAGIPASLGYADVRNHLSTERMRKQMGTDIFIWHGYTSIFLDGVWLKATPAFNIELCEKFRIHTLEFDGRTDSIYHPYDLDGREHMEYVAFRGEYIDVPLDEMRRDFAAFYPNFMAGEQNGNFDQEVDRETA